MAKDSAPPGRAKPYDANNSFVKKVATRVSEIIPPRSWISKWFNSSQDEGTIAAMAADNPECDGYEEEQLQPPPLKRPCIRMDVTHPPGTFSITPRNRNLTSGKGSSKEQYLNHNETTQDFSEPSASGSRLPRFVASTPALQMEMNKVSDTRPTLNMLMSEQNNNGAANGTDDNSESSESTSGCSSLIPQNNRQEPPSNVNYSSPFGTKRRYIEDKLNFTNHLQSPRSLFLDSSERRETLSSRQPSFNPSLVNNTMERSLSSPFYPGNTMFGGANAANMYKRGSSILTQSSQFNLRAPNRASVEVKPSNESSTTDMSGMSHTARRILEALEQFSSPLSDAKKVPIRHVMGGTTSPSFSRKRAREEETSTPRVGLRHLTRELTIPTVPDILKIRRRQRLQQTTVNARKILSARAAANEPSETEKQDYQLRINSGSEPKRNQLKATKKNKNNLEEEDTIEPVNLPNMPLPISNLPRFDFSNVLNVPQHTKPGNSEKPNLPPFQSIPKVDKSNEDLFKFASPIRLSDNAKNLESINNFTFSKPITPSKIPSLMAKDDSSYELSRTLSVESNDTLSSTNDTIVQSFPNFMFKGPVQNEPNLKEKQTEGEFAGFKPASELKSGSVMDFFAKQTFKVDDSSNIWECSECLIKNNDNGSNYCVGCKSAKQKDSSSDIEMAQLKSGDQDVQSIEKPQESKNSTIPSMKTFTTLTSVPSMNFGKSSPPVSKPASTINTDSSSSIIILDSDEEKSGSSEPDIIMIDSAPKKVETPLPPPPKPPKSSWECPCCMVRNLETASSCPCCNTAKPGTVNVSPKRTVAESTHTPVTMTFTSGFGDKFKKPEGSWTCDTCMISNKSEMSKCVACETPKPGAKPAEMKLPAISSFGDKFKKPEGSWTCDTCMIPNKSELTKCAACETPKPGSGVSAQSSSRLQFKVDMPANTGAFKFGIDKADDVSKVAAALPKTNGFNFGSTDTNAPTTGFTFGADKTKETSTTGFAFKPNKTVAAAATFQFGTKPATESKDEKDKPAAPTFSFGAIPKSGESIPSASFVFGSPTVISPRKDEEEKKAETKPVTQCFSFGASNSKESDEKDPKSAVTTTPASNFLFGSPKTPVTNEAVKKDDNQPLTTVASDTPKPTFGDAKIATTTPSFSFGATSAAALTTTSVPTTTSSSLFTFGGQQTANTFGSSTSTPFGFGKANTTATADSTPLLNTENKAPLSTFGSGTSGSTFGSSTNQTTPSLFGNIGASTAAVGSSATSENKPLTFGLPAPENKVAPSFGESEVKVPTFGSTLNSSKPAFPSTTSTFGVTENAASPAASPFSSTSNVFGSSTPNTFGSGIFSAATKPSETSSTTPGLFTFGQSAQPVAPTTGFNFSAGSNTAAPASTTTEQKSAIFTFGATSTNTSQVGNGFGSTSGSFGSAAVPAVTPKPAFAFNAPSKLNEAAPTSSFGQPATTPMFNAPASQPTGPPPAYPGTASPAQASGGFNFGTTNMPNSFNFSSAPAQNPGGFNFNAPAPGAAAPTFDPNAQPTFNFTAGTGGAPATFNATPAPARKIRRAVRKLPRS